MTNGQLHKVKMLATQLFIDGHNNCYDAEVQAILCILKAYVQVAKAELGQQIPFAEVIRQPYQSVDDE